MAVAVALDGPYWVTVEGQGLVDLLEFGCLADWTCGKEAGASGEGEDYHILLYFTSCCVVHVMPNDSLLLYYCVAVLVR
jgi:hypothetical protein